MLKIALIDHHLNNYHADTFVSLLHGGALSGEDTQIASAWESNPTGDDWCARHQVPRADSLAEAVASADAVLLLAPDNIDTHPELAAQVLTAGKPIFLDKMLAPSLTDARAIVTTAERFQSPLLSASALRFAVELPAVQAELGGQTASEAVARGLGKWEYYGVHTLSLVLSLMKTGVQRVIDTGTPTARIVTLDYGNGRRALVDCRTAPNEWDVLGWSLAARVPSSQNYVAATIRDYSGFYAALLHNVLAFFRTGAAPISTEEMLTVPAVIEAATRSQAQAGVWQPLDL